MSFIAKIQLGPIKIQLLCFYEYSKTQCENDFPSIKSLSGINARSVMIFISGDYDHQFNFFRKEKDLFRAQFSFYLLAFHDR